MKLLSLSGGGTKIAGLLGAAEVILTEKQYKPDIIIGVSAGAILAVPLAIRRFNALNDMILNMTPKTMWSVPPVNSKGKIRVLNALWRIITGKHSLGDMGALRDAMSKVVTPAMFDAYRIDPRPDCYTLSVTFRTGERVIERLASLSYDDFIDAVIESASIPVFTPGIDSRFDGGVRHHSPAAAIIEKMPGAFGYVAPVTETCIVYSRPKNYRVLNTDWRPRNILNVLERYVEITNTEISKRDAIIEDYMIKERGIKHHGTIYMPAIMQGVYDTDNYRLSKLYYAAKHEARQNFLP